MADQRFCAIRHEDDTSEETGDKVQQGVDELAKQMNNYQSTYTYSSYGPNDHYTLLGFYYDAGPTEDRADHEYYQNFANALEAAHDGGYVNIQDADTWICLDNAAKWGYGDTSLDNPWFLDTSDGYFEVHLGRAFDVKGIEDGFTDPAQISGLFAMHETGHLFGATHDDGTYAVKNQERYNVTPMATGYTCSSSRDTCFASENTPPSKLCHKNNSPCEGGAWCGGCQDLCRHTANMTGETCSNSPRATKENIYTRTPLCTSSNCNNQ